MPYFCIMTMALPATLAFAQNSSNLDCIKDHFKQYEAHVERWFNNLPSEEKKRNSLT
jgi:hypothetical protein